MWMTCAPGPDFPSYILQASIKVAVQPPSSIKQNVEKLVSYQTKDSFRNSRKLYNFHINMFFGLVYFHAILSGRRKYGTVGWNVPYVFDLSDFEVSNAQLSYLMKSPKL